MAPRFYALMHKNLCESGPFTDDLSVFNHYMTYSETHKDLCTNA